MIIQLDNAGLQGKIAKEIINASKKKIIRVLDTLVVKKEIEGGFTVLEETDVTKEQHKELGSVIGALMGLGAEGVLGAGEGTPSGAGQFAERTFGLSDRDIVSIANEVPAGKTLLLVLFEHRWALKLKKATDKANGVVLAEGIVRPEALIAAGATLAGA